MKKMKSKETHLCIKLGNGGANLFEQYDIIQFLKARPSGDNTLFHAEVNIVPYTTINFFQIGCEFQSPGFDVPHFMPLTRDKKKI
jgi:hypothetical protein